MIFTTGLASAQSPIVNPQFHNPVVANFRDNCTIRYLFSDSPKNRPMTPVAEHSLEIPANTTTTHSISLPQDSSKTYLTIVIKGLYDTIASRQFKKVGRIYTPLGK
jgi:hypothetical protein